MTITAKQHILVVDDEESIRDLLKEYLSSQGFEAQVASNVDSALALLSAGHFDLVLSDVRMPGKSGLELLEEMKRKFPDVGVVLLTACEDMSLAVEAMKTGALDYVLKPFHLDQIGSAVRKRVYAVYRIPESEVRRAVTYPLAFSKATSPEAGACAEATSTTGVFRMIENTTAETINTSPAAAANQRNHLEPPRKRAFSSIFSTERSGAFAGSPSIISWRLVENFYRRELGPTSAEPAPASHGRMFSQYVHRSRKLWLS